MLKQRPLAGSFVFAWILLLGSGFRLCAKDQGNDSTLEFIDHERIVFLGGSLFETDKESASLELSFVSRWTDRDLKFRTLGWTGEHVFGQARSTYTNPPTPYKQ